MDNPLRWRFRVHSLQLLGLIGLKDPMNCDEPGIFAWVPASHWVGHSP